MYKKEIWSFRWPGLQCFRGQLSGCWGYLAAGVKSGKDLRGCDWAWPGGVEGASDHGDPEAGLMGKEL